ncbi:MAG: serine/threonine protein kinase [Planctomycetes bacterium]|nr:serine/threonine protein kinase [Planctomycetota bacterium]
MAEQQEQELEQENRPSEKEARGSNNKDPNASTAGIDTLIGRIVVEQGLATSEEVQLCLDLKKQNKDNESTQSLAELLTKNEFVTGRQLSRVRREVEAQRTTQQIPGYVIKRKLGAGAMAKVYLAKQLSLDRYVAIKVLPKKFSSSAQFIERFYKEGQAAAKLNHPNIVQAYDVGQSGEYHYFVMEYVDGKTVFDVMQDNGRFAEQDAIDIILQIADALHHAHARGFVHRDVKPKNVMMSKDGVAKLADMGLARALSDKEAAEAEAGRAFGTPYYISPEQIRGEVNIGPQTDIYSLGATFYHMVTGQVPFDGANPSAVMHEHLKADLVPPDHVNPKLSPGVSEVIEMMMAKSRRQRYQSCQDLMADLRMARQGQSPSIAHKELDLSGLTSGTVLPNGSGSRNAISNGGSSNGSDMDDTAVAPAIRISNKSSGSVFGDPAFLLVVVLLFISVVGNVILGIMKLVEQS